jgi:hypothetical protein
MVRAGLGAVEQRLKVVLQVHRVVLGRLSVHARGAVLASLLERLEPPVDIDERGQGCESHLRTLPSELGDPLWFRGHVHGVRGTRHVFLPRCHDAASPSLPGVPRDGSPGSGVQWDAPTPRRPSRRASMSSRIDTTVASVVRSPRPRPRRRGPGSCRFQSPDPEFRWRRRGFPGSWGTQMVLVRALRPRSDRPRSAGPRVVRPTRPPLMSTTKAPGVINFRSSITRPLEALMLCRNPLRPPGA